MKRMRIVGLCLVAAFALSAIGAGSASALPEIGKCVAKAGGKYTNANCTTKGKGSFEFVKSITKKGFTSAGGEGKLLGASGTEIKCTTQSAKGEYKGTTSFKEVQKVTAKFNGCELPLFKAVCQTKGDAAGEITTTVLGGKLSYTSGKGTKSPVVNQGLTPFVKKKGFAEFECPAVGVVVYVGEGKEKGHETILANVGPVNTMALTSSEVYAAGGKAGEQSPNFVEGKATVIDNLESSLAGPKGTFERSSQVLETVITNEEELEILA